MTDFPASHQDLLDTPVASLATIGEDGFPQVTELWFVHDQGELKLSLNETRRKTRNLMARPKCSLMIVDLQNPYRYLEVRGEAEIAQDADLSFAHGALAAKYDSDVSVHDGPGEKRVTVTLRPVNVYAVDMSG